MKKMKDKLGNEMGYFKGMPRGAFGEILDEMQHEKVNTCRTSSIPLTESWAPEHLDKWRNVFAPYLGEIDFKDQLKFWEFPTWPMADGKIVGDPSMTDIMILTADHQIAIEGKYTEYTRFKDETIAEWLQRGGAGRFLLRPRLKAWFEYLKSVNATKFGDYREMIKECGDVGYQFLHRTASACFKCRENGDRKPVVVYQLFYKKGDAAHIADMEIYKAMLRKWSDMLKLGNLTFLIVSIPVANDEEVEKRFGGLKSEVFEKMKLETVYEFDWQGISVESVLKSEEGK